MRYAFLSNCYSKVMYAAVIDPLSLIWWKMNISVLLIGTLMIIIGLCLSERGRRKFARGLGLFLLFDLFFFEFALFYMGSWNIQWALPLHYYPLMEFCAAIALISRLQWAYEVVLFLGMIGPIQALIAPALPYHGNYFFYDFYISHSAPIFVPIFLTLVEKMRPRPNAWWKSVFGFTVFGACVFYLNLLIGSNYMYLMERPKIAHPFLEIGEWPDYLFLWWGVLMGWSFLVNLFFPVRQSLERQQ